MTDISFYQLTTSPLQRALPLLVEKAYESGARVLVLADKANLKQLDDSLWTAYQQKFIPHGIKEPSKQPVFLSYEADNDNSAGREVLIVTNGAEFNKKHKFGKVLDIFDGNSEAELKAARERYKAYKDQKLDLKYWSQDDNGKWVQK